MSKIDINRPDLYEFGEPELNERTKKRLTEIAECGMEEVMTAEFGYKGVMSGLYIEHVWHYSDEDFKGYMDWAKELIKSKQLTKASEVKREHPLKKYQIWLGNYNLGQGYHEGSEPMLVDEIEAPNFKVACVLHELRNSLKNIETTIANDEYVDHQSCRWFYNFDTNSNSWTGKYYETKEDALASFPK